MKLPGSERDYDMTKEEIIRRYCSGWETKVGRHRQRTCPGFIFISPNDDDQFDQLTFEVQAIVYQMP